MAITVNGVKVAGVGPAGLSPYQVAVAGGYTGTEQEFNQSLAQLNQLFTSVSEGKSAIAAAITDKGVTTAADAAFQQMADNIGAISAGGAFAEVDYQTFWDEATSAEQDAQEQAQAAKATITAIAAAPVTDVAMVRSVVEAGAATLSDGEAAKMPSLSPKWVVGEAVEPGDRRYYEPTGRLYKIREGQGHTTQADWPPDQTPALWAVVDVDHAGTLDDPIPAAIGMDYIYGKYYRDPEDGKTYLCEREGEEPGNKIILQYLPHELIDQYFTDTTEPEPEPEEPTEI